MDDFASQLKGLRATLGKMEVALSAVSNAIVWTDSSGKVQWCNTLFEKLVAKNKLLFLGKSLVDLLPLYQEEVPIDLEQHPVQMTLAHTERGMDYFEFHHNDTIRILEIDWSPVFFGETDLSVVLVIRDVTEKKKDEQELQKYREHLEVLVAERTAEVTAANAQLQESEASIRSLYEITFAYRHDFETCIQELLRLGRKQFDLDMGMLSRIQGDRYEPLAVQLANDITVNGVNLSLSQTYCQEVVAHQKTLAILRASHSKWQEHDCYQHFKVESYLGTPVWVSGEIYGTLSFFSQAQRDAAFTAVNKELLRLIAQWIGGEIERQQSEHALEKARDQALTATRAKSEFLATMSHEIRTPMNAVIGMTGILLDTQLTTDQQDYVETIRTGGDALLTLINDILDFSKIEAGKLDLERHPFQLRTCVEEAFDLLVSKAGEKGLELAFQIDPAVPRQIMGDVTRLRQILVNLLSNAIKFTEQGEIFLQVKDAEQPQQAIVEGHSTGPRTLLFSVRDTGIGIPSDRLDRLFQPFSQVDSSTTRKYGGTGLGLAICKQLCEMMGGTLWVESTVNVGTTFHFTITAEALADRATKSLEKRQQHLAGKRLLIVDDNVTNRMILDRQTSTWGMYNQAVESSDKALQLLHRGEEFDIAIVDMQMPEMDGVALAKAIKQLPEYQHLPLVMLTSIGRSDLNKQDIDTLFAAFLNKPIKQSQLFNVIVDILGGQKIQVRKSTAIDPESFATFAKTYPLKILLAEDNVVNQKIALLLLKRMGYRADVASNGLDVLAALDRQSYDLVLMDVQMPEMDGITATQEICQRFAEPVRPRIVAMTANAMQGDREMCIEAGMDEYVSKPIRIEALVEAIRKCIPVTTKMAEAKSAKPESPEAESPEAESTPSLSTMTDIVHPAASAPEPATRDFIVDEATLRQMFQELDHDLPVFQHLLDTYFQDSAELLNKVETAVHSADASALALAAHTLKSSSAMFGAEHLATLCAQLEKMGRTSDLTNVAAIAAALRQEYAQVESVLREKSTRLSVPTT